MTSYTDCNARFSGMSGGVKDSGSGSGEDEVTLKFVTLD